MDLLKNWDKVKMYDLTQPLSHLTPPWPTRLLNSSQVFQEK